MQSWANVANITFVEVEESGNTVGDIRFSFSSAVTDAWWWSYLPSNDAFSGDIWINPNMDASNLDFSVGGYGYSSLMHELGHSLGFKHPGYYGYGDEGPFLSTFEDNQQYTVMSYHSAFGNWMHEDTSYVVRFMWDDIEVTDFYVLPETQTPMVYDILAIQYLYGANTTYHTVDDIYFFDENTAPFLMTIWDAGGNDTISVLGSINSSFIDLNEGAYSSIQTSRFRGYDIIFNRYEDGLENLGIAYGAIIENAIGGENYDEISGNYVANILDGQGGDDIIYGGDGNDTIYSGAGIDRLYGDQGNDVITGGRDDDIIYGKDGNDILNGGNGNDTFIFDTSIDSDHIDTIEDFEFGDKIKLDINIFAKATSSSSSSSILNESQFYIGTDANDENDYIIYDQSTGRLYYDADGNGSGASVVFATLSNKPIDLAYNDLVVI